MGAWVTYGLGSEIAGPARLRRLQLGQERPQRRQFQLGQRLPADASTRASSSAAAATRSCTSPTRRASTDELQRDSLDAVGTLNRLPSRRRRRPRNRHPHQLVRDGLPHAVQRAGADGLDPASRSTCSTCTAPSRASPRSPTTACSPAGWSSAACASSSSSTKPGTSTATSSTTSRRTARIPTRPVPRSIKDLKQRGLLDDTLVIWGGEFGRTPMVQGGNDGRDHHPNAFTMWLAGGGIKPGSTLGATDDLGFNVVEDRVHVHDLHATHPAPARASTTPSSPTASRAATSA